MHAGTTKIFDPFIYFFILFTKNLNDTRPTTFGEYATCAVRLLGGTFFRRILRAAAYLPNYLSDG